MSGAKRYSVILAVAWVLAFPESAPSGKASTAAVAPYKAAAWKHLQTLAGLGPRNPGSAGHRKAREYILQIGRQYADKVVEQKFIHRSPGQPPLPMVNLELKFSGADPDRLPILLGAHYDTRPYADKEPDPALHATPIPGANDGGSGTALLLALARYLHENQPQTPVNLVFFDGEDFGKEGHKELLLGSTFYANQLGKPAESRRPFLALIVDMVADKDLQIYKEFNSVKSAPWLVNIIYRVALQKHNYPQFKDKIKYQILDDHVPLIHLDIPSVVLIDLDYPHWHKLTDTLERCSAESMHAVFTVVVDTLRALNLWGKPRARPPAPPFSNSKTP
ncbi:MAG: M28 family peptidase [Nitrospinales bacterium]